MIQHVECFEADLKLALAVDVEPAEDTNVHHCLPWTAELVAMRVAEDR